MSYQKQYHVFHQHAKQGNRFHSQPIAMASNYLSVARSMVQPYQIGVYPSNPGYCILVRADKGSDEFRLLLFIKMEKGFQIRLAVHQCITNPFGSKTKDVIFRMSTKALTSRWFQKQGAILLVLPNLISRSAGLRLTGHALVQIFLTLHSDPGHTGLQLSTPKKYATGSTSRETSGSCSSSSTTLPRFIKHGFIMSQGSPKQMRLFERPSFNWFSPWKPALPGQGMFTTFQSTGTARSSLKC